MAQHKTFTVATNVKVYFCDPKVPGSGAPTKTPTCFYGNTSHEERICPSIRKRNSIELRFT